MYYSSQGKRSIDVLVVTLELSERKGVEYQKSYLCIGGWSRDPALTALCDTTR
jgi:hypothetical protein